jgi:hypothetical protein
MRVPGDDPQYRRLLRMVRVLAGGAL